MRKLVLLLITCWAAFGQSMLESGAVIAGTTIGSAAGKKVSDGVNSRLKKTGRILDTAARAEPRQTKTAPTAPLLQVGAGVPKAEVNNVPPPPPRRIVTRKPTKIRTVDVPMVMSSVIPAAPLPTPANVDLAGIHIGMERDSVLALGIPSARITMYEDQHLIEIYQYRSAATASGTVRLRDGAVWAVEARP